MQRLTLADYPQITPLDDPDYPSSDGERMADNMLQFRWIMAIQGGIDTLFLADPNVLVAGDCLWYPVEGDNNIRVAPDTMVIFGRPKEIAGRISSTGKGESPFTSLSKFSRRAIVAARCSGS